jgi:hypothetical protein
MAFLPRVLGVHALYPNRYVWFVFASTLDILLTHAILHHFSDFGGRELNTIADWVIRRFDIWGAITLKFVTVLVVITACEIVGRKNPRTGSRLATTVLILSLIPPGVALWQLLAFALREF